MRGRLADAHDRHVRFRRQSLFWPARTREKAAGVWLSHDTPESSVMMQIPPVGAFVRALLPIRLAGGHTP
jgi:hypothetical protein